MEPLESVSFDDGKYVLTRHSPGCFVWTRHGESWPAANPPDKKDIAIFFKVQELEEKIKQLQKELAE